MGVDLRGVDVGADSRLAMRAAQAMLFQTACGNGRQTILPRRRETRSPRGVQMCRSELDHELHPALGRPPGRP